MTDDVADYLVVIRAEPGALRVLDQARPRELDAHNLRATIVGSVVNDGGVPAKRAGGLGERREARAKKVAVVGVDQRDLHVQRRRLTLHRSPARAPTAPAAWPSRPADTRSACSHRGGPPSRRESLGT